MWLEANFTSFGVLSSVTIEMGDEVPEDPDGTPGFAPSKSYRPIIQITTDDSGITQILPLRKGSLDVVAIVTGVGCGVDTKAYFWSLGA